MEPIHHKSTYIACILPGIQQIVGLVDMIRSIYELKISLDNYKALQPIFDENKKVYTRIRRLEGDIMTATTDIQRQHSINRQLKKNEEVDQSHLSTLRQTLLHHTQKALKDDRFYSEQKQEAKNKISQAKSKIFRGVVLMTPIVSTIYSIAMAILYKTQKPILVLETPSIQLNKEPLQPPNNPNETYANGLRIPGPSDLA